MKQNRRKFFGLVGAGTLGVAVSQLVPFKVLAGDDNASAQSSKPKVTIHPLAVPRTKRSN
jgi:hypothetical protein